ncbi:uncharacterized protein DUF3164 [Volucribacter psittacicida]|uniref:Uncharacterized protein DUF3164 n=1 Tax=Volucribacter psittacicida TaxID=203482 RepID=A0A4R1FNZ5_9PAST|nr:DUF3164 family protein [Volucribacter psittacicida]TCJ95930.1 uncharacterized protein DUF3164 [Volucribacter psittacicida]
MSKTVIEGKTYWKDAKGHLTPDELVREIDKERDALVRDFVEKAMNVQQAMKAFKQQVFNDVGAFVDLSSEKYGVKMGGRKGNLTLFTYDGKYKLQVAVSDHIRFDERIHAAKTLIDECLHEWSVEARPELRSLIDNAFQVDKEGNLSTARIFSLRKVDIQDERWLKAMQAISDSMQVISSKDYIRFYERDEQGKYQPVSLDMAGV